MEDPSLVVPNLVVTDDNKPDESKSRTNTSRSRKPSDAKSTDGIDLDFSKQLRHNVAIFIPLLFISLLILAAGTGLSAQAALDIFDAANNDSKLYAEIKSGSVPKTTFFISGTVIAAFGVFAIMIVTVIYLDRREKIVNRRKIIEEEQRLQRLKAKPKNLFDVLLSAARENKSPQP